MIAKAKSKDDITVYQKEPLYAGTYKGSIFQADCRITFGPAICKTQWATTPAPTERQNPQSDITMYPSFLLERVDSSNIIAEEGKEVHPNAGGLIFMPNCIQYTNIALCED